MGMVSPVAGRVTSEWSPSRKNPATGKIEAHAGIDIANVLGTPIYAAFAGTVDKAGWNIVAGRTGQGVLVRNPDGERQYYGHVSKTHVSAGQRVKAGQHIADLGATGNVTGPHLHFEIWANASPASNRNPRIDFAHFGITPGANPNTTTSEDWFTMATEAQLTKIVRDVVREELTSLPRQVWSFRNPDVNLGDRDTYSLLRGIYLIADKILGIVEKLKK